MFGYFFNIQIYQKEGFQMLTTEQIQQKLTQGIQAAWTQQYQQLQNIPSQHWIITQSALIEQLHHLTWFAHLVQCAPLAQLTQAFDEMWDPASRQVLADLTINQLKNRLLQQLNTDAPFDMSDSNADYQILANRWLHVTIDSATPKEDDHHAS